MIGEPAKDREAGRRAGVAEGARFPSKPAGILFFRTGALLTDTLCDSDFPGSKALFVLLKGNAEGGTIVRRALDWTEPLAFLLVVKVGGVDVSELFVCFKDTTPPVDFAFDIETLFPPNDVPAATERDVRREKREGASEGGLAAIEHDNQERGACWRGIRARCARRSARRAQTPSRSRATKVIWVPS